MQYLVLDLETTVNGGPNADSPEAHWHNNEVLMAGWQWAHQPRLTAITPDIEKLIHQIHLKKGEALCIVAHNAKFDIKYLMREAFKLGYQIDWHEIHVWDTMTWQYLYEGHSKRLPSLEYCCDFWKLPNNTKTIDLGSLLKSGIKMEDINEDTLAEYLENDVVMLRALFETQRNTKEVHDMDHLLPLCEMELNGLPIDQAQAKAMHVDLTKDLWDHLSEMMEYIEKNCEWQDGSPIVREDFSDILGIKSKCIKPFANRTISFLLFGEPNKLKITPKWVVNFKKGSKPLYDPEQYYFETPTHIGYPMDETKLSSINAHAPNPLIDLVLSFRLDSKLDGTYIGPFVNVSKEQGCVYPKLNTAITGTGRLSSSQPNGQNMPEIARKLVVAPEGRELEELDFSQLEMVAVAAVSECPDLIKDLEQGVDVHQETASEVFGPAKAKAMRKIAKNVNFGVLYGGKAPGLSKQTGVDKDVVQMLIDAFFSKYPRIKQWQEEVYEDVVDNMRAYDVKNGEQRYCSDWILPVSGRKFRFIENDAPTWIQRQTGRKFSFSPNHTANYPIQGFAGGDIVMSALLQIWKRVSAEELDVKFRMTVHDSILIERPVSIDITNHYVAACRDVERKFNLPLELQFEVESGKTWQ